VYTVQIVVMHRTQIGNSADRVIEFVKELAVSPISAKGWRPGGRIEANIVITYVSPHFLPFLSGRSPNGQNRSQWNRYTLLHLKLPPYKNKTALSFGAHFETFA
jgi:hypothetical protein